LKSIGFFNIIDQNQFTSISHEALHNKIITDLKANDENESLKTAINRTFIFPPIYKICFPKANGTNQCTTFVDFVLDGQ
jgi:hypothetical protein